MELLILYLFAIIAASTRSVLNKKGGEAGGGALFNLARSASAFLLFLIPAVVAGFDMHKETLIYATAYGFFVFSSCFFGLKSLECGPLSITSSLVAFALVIPCLYGAIRYSEPISPFDVVGFALIAAAILMLKRKDKKSSVGFKRGWPFYLLTTIISDGCHSTIKVIHQKNFPGMYLYEFMTIGMLVGVVLFGIVTVFSQKRQATTDAPAPCDVAALVNRAKKPLYKLILIYGGAAGIANGLYHFLVLYLSSMENATALFPILSVSTMAASIILGKIIFGERLTRLQLAGVVAAMLAVLFIKI